MDNHFKIIVPLYNVEKWIKRCLRSIKLQTYKNFECIIIDDISTDNSANIIAEEIKNDSRFRLIVNKEKKYALRNIYDSLKEVKPNDDDIIITVDGDDWLAGKDVLSYLNDIYNKNNCWMTYGSYIEYPSKIKGKFAKQLPQEIILSNSFREYEWCTSHLRTFKHFLWDNIKKEDLINPNTNKFIKSAWDLAFMFPMLEMSGLRSLYIEKPLYIYNRENPLNEDKIDHKTQLEEENISRRAKKYSRLKKHD